MNLASLIAVILALPQVGALRATFPEATKPDGDKLVDRFVLRAFNDVYQYRTSVYLKNAEESQEPAYAPVWTRALQNASYSLSPLFGPLLQAAITAIVAQVPDWTELDNYGDNIAGAEYLLARAQWIGVNARATELGIPVNQLSSDDWERITDNAMEAVEAGCTCDGCSRRRSTEAGVVDVFALILKRVSPKLAKQIRDTNNPVAAERRALALINHIPSQASFELMTRFMDEAGYQDVARLLRGLATNKVWKLPAHPGAEQLEALLAQR